MNTGVRRGRVRFSILSRQMLGCSGTGSRLSGLRVRLSATPGCRLPRPRGFVATGTCGAGVTRPIMEGLGRLIGAILTHYFRK